jgi:hypothetical protein
VNQEVESGYAFICVRRMQNRMSETHGLYRFALYPRIVGRQQARDIDKNGAA